MSIINKYSRGSEWRKWDLHAHSPLDYEWVSKPRLNNDEDKKQFAHEYINFAKSQNISVIAITDHNFCNDTNDLIIPYIMEEASQDNITILPGFEITTRDGSGVHLLIIFPENTCLDKIKSVVDQMFNPGQDKIPSSRRIPVSTKDIDQVKAIIDSSSLEALYIFAHADRENGVLDSGTFSGETRVGVWQKDYVKICQLSKAPSDYDSESFIYKVINGLDQNYRKDMTYIVASDCRSINDSGDNPEGRFYLGQKYVWIKADPTFEGLKQIIYEPNERVRIQVVNPDLDYTKPYFSNISINTGKMFRPPSVSFTETNIPLNKDMIAIIGGRGSGKSVLLDALFKTFNQNKRNERSDEIIMNEGFDIQYKKSHDSDPDNYKIGDDNVLSYLHVTQGEVKDVVHPPSKLFNQIYSILGIKTEYSEKHLDEDILYVIKEMNNIREWFEYIDSDENRPNTRQYVEKNIDNNQRLIGTLTTTKNKKYIDQYLTNNNEIYENKNRVERLNDLKSKINSMSHMINTTIEVLNDELANNIPLIDITDQLNVIESNITQLNEKLQSLKTKNQEIETIFKGYGLKEDIAGLKDKLNQYNDDINKLNKQLQEISDKETSYEELRDRRDKFVFNFLNELKQQKRGLTNNWNELKLGKEEWSLEQKELVTQLLSDIEITAEVIFDVDTFAEELYNNYLNGRKFRRIGDKEPLDRVKDSFNIYNAYSFFRFIHNLPVFRDDSENYLCLDELLISDYIPYNQVLSLLKFLFVSTERKKYLKIIPIVRYKGKSPEKLSVGQRGTLFVCLKLATDAFYSPFVFDQPEDDLDNEFIMKDLVPIFKKIKKYRQVIIVTHNANLVVNSDVEQVVVAHNENEELYYISGSLENSYGPIDSSIEPNTLKRKGIRQHVYDILEGGKTAFEQRERKYGFKK